MFVGALAALIAAAYGLEVAGWQYDIAVANTLAALDALTAAIATYNEAYSDWIDAYTALYECLSG